MVIIGTVQSTDPVTLGNRARIGNMIGTILGNRYKLIAELGSGGMAWVYLAEDLVEHRKVAVKVLYPQYSQDLGFLQRFAREARLSMTLSQCSPQQNIVCVLDYGADRDTHYLVMEYVPGQDLGRILAEEGPLSWQRALDITRQVALALEQAYQLDIVHRDIKPSNIMIRPDGAVLVLDFGIARARAAPDLTLSGFVGSPHYAAPEQATGQPVDIRADIYSLGVVLYRILSGDLPFQGDTPWAVVNQHIVSSPPSLAERCPDLPQPIIHLAQKAMARRPEDRFQTPNEIVQAIDAIVAGLELPFEPLPVTSGTAVVGLEVLYQRAQQAAQAERWQEAVDLFSQILRIDPEYRDVTNQLGEVSQQIRLANLYRAAQRALESGEWERALAQLDRIRQVSPDYKDIADLRVRAERKEKLTLGGGTGTSEFPTQAPTADTDDAGVRADLFVSPDTRPAQALPPEQPRRRRRWPAQPRRSLLWVGIALLSLVLAAAIYFALTAQGEPTATPVAHTQVSPTATTHHTSTPVLIAPVASRSPTPQPVRTTPTSSAAAVSEAPTSSPEPTAISSVPTANATRTPTPSPSPTFTPTPTPIIPTIITTKRSLTGQIVFPRFDPARGTYDVYVCRVDGSGCGLVVNEASQPDFLPAGDQLVVHSWKSDEKGLILFSLSGQRIWRITEQIEAARPSVDFQGKIYVYHSRQEIDRQPRLFRTYNSDTGPILREASPVFGQSPSWVPDGQILYSGCWQNACGILAMRANGTFPRQVVAGGQEANPEASPTGQQVAFMSQRDGNWEVYVVNLDGGNLRRLTKNPGNDGLPAWSPDGRYIAFVTDRDGPWAIWIMRPDGSEQRRLFTIGGPLDGQVRNAAAHEIHGWVEERISWAP